MRETASPFFIIIMAQNAAKLISGAILSLDNAMVSVAGKRYLIPPPTIHRIAGAAYYLSDIKDGKTLMEILSTINNSTTLAKALSWFIAGNTSLYKTLSKGTIDEIVNALEVAYSLISAESFIKLSTLARSVASLTAKQK